MSHQRFAVGLQARNIYHQVKIYFCKEHANVTRKEPLTTTFALWIDARSSPGNTLRNSTSVVEISRFLFQKEKAAKGIDGDLICHVYSLEDAVAYLAVSNPRAVLTIEK